MLPHPMTYRKIISYSLKSEEVFLSYILNPRHACQAYLAFTHLQQVYNAAKSKVAMLKKEINELEHTKYHIESAFTYIEK